jgi:hypothetical protein
MSSVSSSPVDDIFWERVWREATDEQLADAAKGHLWQCLQSPDPGFFRLTQISKEAHRRGKPELLLCAVEALAPIRTATGEVRVLLGVIERLTDLLGMAGKEIVMLSGQRESPLLDSMRARIREAKEAAGRFLAPGAAESEER